MTARFPLDLVRCDTREISRALDESIITTVALVQEYLARIRNDNHRGRCLRAVLQLAPEDYLLAQAQQLDDSRRHAKLGPLHGIPILIKDVIATGPDSGLDTTAGTPALLTSRPREDAAVVKQLRAAGVIVLGKTNMSILNGWYHPQVPTGWSPIGGQVISAFGLDLPVLGSSTGSAVAVSAGWCGFALGVETCGSVTTPASLAGLYALKPSAGRLDTRGLVPNGAHLDTIGVMGRSARDLALQLDVLFQQTALCEAIESTAPPKVGIINLRQCETSSEEQSLLASAIKAWPRAVTADVWLEHYDASRVSNDLAVTYRSGFESAWQDYLAATDGPLETLGDVVAWHDQHPLVSFHPAVPGQDNFRKSLGYRPHDGDAVAVAQRYLDQIVGAFQTAMDRNELEVLVWPGPEAALVAAAGGLPSCTVPAGVKGNGCPFGLTAVARRNREDLLIRFMATAEKAFGPRPVPCGF